MPESASTSLPYHEPEITTLLIQSSLLILLNAINFVLDRLLYCGLIGQILLGIAWGTPGSKWLETCTETAIVELGYLGLLLLVYEGGLSTSLRSLKANAWVSVTVAMTGISLPIALSFALMRLTNATPLQCFAAGASLSSTSLGTTFTVLGTSGLTKSRLGVVLTTAAMMDDVVGLVLVQVITNLGKEGASVTASTVIRPLLVAVGFIVLTPMICVFLVKPLTRRINQLRKRLGPGICNHLMTSERTSLFTRTLILVGYVVASSYAGTSNLFAAYLAGASVSWWDTEIEHCIDDDEMNVVMSSGDGRNAGLSVNEAAENLSGTVTGPQTSKRNSAPSGLQTYRRFFLTPVDRILKPFFFASIGFSIPITEMFSGDIVWKGFVYATLMSLAKLACGVWLMRMPNMFPVSWTSMTKMARQVSRHRLIPSIGHFGAKQILRPTGAPTESVTSPAPQACASHTRAANNSSRSTASAGAETVVSGKKGEEKSTTNGNGNQDEHDSAVPATLKPRSLYPASIVGCAMVARGEIGFLISSIAESNRVFSTPSETSSTSDLFLVVTWAIVLCTVLGPVAVGLLVRRVRKLQNGVEKEGRTLHRDVLGTWGIS
ncbi:hypothetical protein E4U41_001960 [Claviceps citrina]|nr:hypothetical protein E4U41_001960 [Claviceps citrina]